MIQNGWTIDLSNQNLFIGARASNMKFSALLCELGIVFLAMDTVLSFSLSGSSTEIQRTGYCASNVQYCNNICLQLADINICNSKTLIWDCNCNTHASTLTIIVTEFPIAYTQCIGEQHECLVSCSSNPALCASCSTGCGGPTAQQTTTLWNNTAPKIDLPMSPIDASSSSRGKVSTDALTLLILPIAMMLANRFSQWSIRIAMNSAFDRFSWIKSVQQESWNLFYFP